MEQKLLSQKISQFIYIFFWEDQTRYIIEIEENNMKTAEKILKGNNVYYENMGFTQKEHFEIEGELKISNKDLYKINNQWYNNY